MGGYALLIVLPLMFILAIAMAMGPLDPGANALEALRVHLP